MLVTPISNKTEAKGSLAARQLSHPISRNFRHDLTVQTAYMPVVASAKNYANINFRGEKELYEAVCNDHPKYEQLKQEIEKGTDINCTYNDQYTPLTWLVGCVDDDTDKYKCIELLLSQPDIDVNKLSEWKDGMETALMRAVRRGDLSSVKYILQHPNVDVNIKNSKGRTALDLAKERNYQKIPAMIKSYMPGLDGCRGVSVVVNINKLSPKENIWTEAQISNKFLLLVNSKQYDLAEFMLQNTPLIDLEGNDYKILNKVCGTENAKFVRKVFEYEKNQPKMKEEYESKRKDFLENTIKTMPYEELKTNPIVMSTADGFRVLMEKEEFNPNDVVDADKNQTLFKIAADIDNNGGLVKEILSKYDDVDTQYTKTVYNNGNIKTIIDEYESKGKYQLRMDNIKRKLISTATRNEGISQLKDFINSEEFKPEMTDTMGNSALHIVSTIADDSSRGLIEKLIRKGVDVNAQNVTSQNPIMSAIRALMGAEDEDTKERLLSNIKFLIDKGVNLEDVDVNGQTVFHYVCATTSMALLAMVLKHEPNVLVRDLKGNRPHTYLKTPEMKEKYREYLLK